LQVQKPKQGYKLVKSNYGRYEEIPEEWEISKISKFLDITMGQSPPSETYNEKGIGLPFYQGVTDFGEINPMPTVWCSNANKTANPDQILFSVRAPVGEINLNTSRCYMGRGISSLTPKNSDLKYCFYLLKQFKSHFIQYSQGTTYDAINKNEIGMTKLIYTQNISEQKKIALIISHSDTQIQQTQKIIEYTKKLKNGLMQRLLTKGIGHTKFKQIHVIPRFIKFSVPESWDIKKLKEISIDIKDGPMGFALHNYDYVEVGIPILRIQNLKNLTVTKNDLRFISKKKHEELQKSQVKPNDIIISKTGILGCVGVVPKDYGPANLNQALARIQLKDNELVNYVSMFLVSKIPQQILSVVGSGRTVQAGLKMSDIKDLIIAIPPKEELKKIINILSEVSSFHTKQEEYKSNLENLKKGLMQNLLMGKIRVNF